MHEDNNEQLIELGAATVLTEGADEPEAIEALENVDFRD